MSMKKLLILFIFICVLRPQTIQAAPITTNDRSQFTYELLNLVFYQNEIRLQGWAFITQNQNLYGDSTHSFRIELISNGKTHSYPAETLDRKLTDIMTYDGYPTCKDSDTKRNNCNYKYENVGFKAAIKMLDLPVDQSYAFYLVMETKQTKASYRSPLHFAHPRVITQDIRDVTYSIDVPFIQMSFDVFYHTLRATTTPSISTETNRLRMGTSCSSGYGNLSFYKQGSHFKTIKGSTYYQGLVPYYEVQVQDAGCADSRRRVSEGKGPTVHIPSTYINYTGKPLTLDIVKHTAPVISANDHIIEQYSEYKPLDYASALDKVEGDITNKLKITKTTVNTRYPGMYESCYEVTNKRGTKTTKCVRVEVEKIPVRTRYINKGSIDYANLSIWKLFDLRRLLRK